MTAARKGKDDPRIAFMMRAINLSSHAYHLAGLLCWEYGSKEGRIFPAGQTGPGSWPDRGT